MWSSSGQAPDGRPLTEVESVERSPDGLRLSGTACAFEGTMLLHVSESDGNERLVSTQASQGGPGRGTWSAELPVSSFPAQVTVSDEDPRDGSLSTRAAVHLAVSEDGAVQGAEADKP